MMVSCQFPIDNQLPVGSQLPSGIFRTPIGTTGPTETDVTRLMSMNRLPAPIGHKDDLDPLSRPVVLPAHGPHPFRTGALLGIVRKGLARAPVHRSCRMRMAADQRHRVEGLHRGVNPFPHLGMNPSPVVDHRDGESII